MICSSSSARSAWRRRASVLALALVLAPFSARAAAAAETVQAADVEQAWFRLTQSLEPFSRETLPERADDLLQVARRAELVRLTPMALALVVRSRSLAPADAQVALEQAARLDPKSAEVSLARAQLALRMRSPVMAATSLARGVTSLVHDPRLAHAIRAGLMLSGVIAFLAIFVLWSLVSIRRVIAPLWHDLIELGAYWRLGPNAPVLAILILLLPFFVGFDPAWLLLWLVALCWAYLPTWHKALGAAGLAGVFVAPLAIETGFRMLTHPPSAVERAAIALSEKSYEPQLIDEVTSLADVLGDDPAFRRLQGDCYRQIHSFDAATAAYREGLRLAPDNPDLSLGLATVSFLEGDYNAALQWFQTARDNGGDPVITNFNLSLTLALTYHFVEGEQAIKAAREAGASRLARMTRGRPNQPILPVLNVGQARELLERKDPVLLLNRGLVPPPLLPERTVLHPIALAAFGMLLLAGAHYFVRQRTTGYAVSCMKCGRAFCRRCRLAQESQSYCAQCVNIFLKKDMVAIEAQLAKRQQLKRHQTWKTVERRASDLLLPGLGLAFSGRPLLGVLLGVVTASSAMLALVMLPRFLSPALLGVSLLPLQIAAAIVWALAAVTAQVVDVDRR